MKEFYIDYCSNNCFSITNKCQRKKLLYYLDSIALFMGRGE